VSTKPRPSTLSQLKALLAKRASACWICGSPRQQLVCREVFGEIRGPGVAYLLRAFDCQGCGKRWAHVVELRD
jgi:hypothetical protein